eukprot:6472129-Amphidinium_carterae.1
MAFGTSAGQGRSRASGTALGDIAEQGEQRTRCQPGRSRRRSVPQQDGSSDGLLAPAIPQLGKSWTLHVRPQRAVRTG